MRTLLRKSAMARRFRKRCSLVLLKANEGGLAAVEFSLILPVLVLLWFGGVEITQGLSVDRHLNNLSSSIGDLVSRCKQVTESNMTNIFNIAPGAMFPFQTTGLQMRVSAVNIDSAQVAKIAWSRGSGISKYNAGTTLNTTVLPTSLRTPNTQIIIAEVYYPYTPAVGYVITGTVSLTDRMYFVPRLVNTIPLCNDAKTDCTLT